MKSTRSKSTFNPIEKFLLFCAGVDQNVLASCLSEKNKYIGMGAVVLFTGMLATLSGGYAIQTLTDQSTVIISFSLFWGLVIFNLDRFIVSSIKKEGKPRKEMMLAMPRIILAIMISIVVSKPLEIEIMKNQINLELEQNLRDSLETFPSSLSLYSTLETKENRLEDLIDIQDNLNQEIRTVETGPQLQGIREANGTAQRAYLEQKQKSDFLILGYNEEIRRIKAEYGYKHLKEAEKVEKLSSQDSIRLRRIKSKIGPYIRKIGEQRAETEKKKALYQSTTDSLDANEDHRYNQLQIQILSATEEKLQLQNAIPVLKDSIRIELEDYKVHLEKYNEGIVAQIEGLRTLGKKKPGIKFVSWGIMLLIIMLELSPILVKVMIGRGPYDRLLSNREIEDENISIINTNASLEREKNTTDNQMKLFQAKSAQFQEIVHEWAVNHQWSHPNLWEYLKENFEELDLVVAPLPAISSSVSPYPKEKKQRGGLRTILRNRVHLPSWQRFFSVLGILGLVIVLLLGGYLAYSIFF